MMTQLIIIPVDEGIMMVEIAGESILFEIEKDNDNATGKARNFIHRMSPFPARLSDEHLSGQLENVAAGVTANANLTHTMINAETVVWEEGDQIGKFEVPLDYGGSGRLVWFLKNSAKYWGCGAIVVKAPEGLSSGRAVDLRNFLDIWPNGTRSVSFQYFRA